MICELCRVLLTVWHILVECTNLWNICENSSQSILLTSLAVRFHLGFLPYVGPGAVIKWVNV